MSRQPSLLLVGVIAGQRVQVGDSKVQHAAQGGPEPVAFQAEPV